MHIWVYSHFTVFSEALVLLVREMGFEASLYCEPQSELALWDLTGQSPPYPEPPALPTLALVSAGEANLAGLIKQQYSGYVKSADDKATLKQALKAVRRGEIWADRKVLASTIRSFTVPTLTVRERETLSLLSKGLSNRAIAEQLNITEGTVKMHVSHLFDKLGTRSRSELIVRWLEKPEV